MADNKLEFETSVNIDGAVESLKRLKREADKLVKIDPKNTGVEEFSSKLRVAAKSAQSDLLKVQKALEKATTPEKSVKKYGELALNEYLKNGETTDFKKYFSYLKGYNTKGYDVNDVFGNLKNYITDAQQLVSIYGEIDTEQQRVVDGASGFTTETASTKENLEKMETLLEDMQDSAKKAQEAMTQATPASVAPEGLVEDTQTGIDTSADVTKMSLLELIQYIRQAKAEMRELEHGDSATAEQSQRYDALKDSLARASAQLKQYQTDSRITMQQVAQGISVAQRAVGLLQSAVNGVINVFKRLASVAQNVAKKIWSVLKSVGKSISSFFSSIYNGLSKDADKAFSVKNLKRSLNMLTKYVFGFRSFFFLYRKLRAGIGEGLKNLVQFNDGANDTNYAISELRTSLLYLKNAWAAAFAPIINVVYPILVGLMDLLASVGNAIARFIAALTGQSTVLQAVKVDAGSYADTLKAAGGSAGSAAKKQEDLNDRLADFDDLNVLGVDKDKTTPSGGGGGGGAGDITPSAQEMFEQINTPFNRLADMLRKAWETGDGFDFGRALAESFSKGLDDAHNWLTGEGHDKMMKIANLIGTTLDGVLSVDSLGSQIGQVFADLFDFGLDFVDTIITPDRMYKIGVQVAEAFNTAIPQVIPRIGESLGNLFKSAISYAWGFVSTADFSEWGESIGKAINNIFDQMGSVVTSASTKGTIKDPIGNMLSGWQVAGQTITKLARGILDLITSAIQEVDWHEVGRAIGEFLGSIDVDDIKEGLGGLWDAVKEAIGDLWEGFSEENPELADDLKGLLKDLEKIAMIIGVIAYNLATLKLALDGIMAVLGVAGTVGGIVTGLQSLGVIGAAGGAAGAGAFAVDMAAFSAVGAEAGEALAEGTVVAFEEGVEVTIADSVATAGAEASTTATATGTSLGTKILAGLGDALAVGVGVTGLSVGVGEIFQGINDIADNWDEYEAAGGTIGEAILGGVEETFVGDNSLPHLITGGIGEALADLHNAGVNPFEAMFASAEESITGNSEHIEQLAQQYADFNATAEEAIDDVAVSWEKSGTAIENTISSYQQGIADYYARTQGGLGELSNKIQSTFTETSSKATASSNEMSTKFKDSFNQMKAESESGARLMSDNFTLAATNIGNAFTDTWNKIKASLMEGGDLFTPLTTGINTTFKTLLNGLITGLNVSITKPLQDVSKSFNILRALDVNGARPFAGIPYLNVPTIPHLAQGAVIPPNREFMAVLGDQRSGTNVEAPLDTIKQAVAEVMGDGGNAQVIALLQQLISVVQSKNLTIGDREIGKANARYEAEQKLIKGTMI